MLLRPFGTLKPDPDMRAIEAFRKSGFSDNVLLPIIPHNGTKDARAGKSPGTLNSNGDWVGLSKWAENGVDPSVLTSLDKLNANCGVRLGVPSSSGDTLVFVDIDTEPGADINSRDGKVAQAITALTIQVLKKHLKNPFWVRKSRPGRGGVFLRIARGSDPGTKDVLHLSNIENAGVIKPRGKIEVLAHGQQCAVGGIHPFNNGTPIEWYRTDAVGQFHAAPDFQTIPVLDSRQTLTDILLDLKSELEAKKIVVTRRAGKMADDFADMSDEEKAPPSAEILINTLDQMPHDDRVIRQDYVNIMRSVAECIRVMEKRNDDFDMRLVEEAAVEWASRWPGADFEAEEAKWCSDFKNSESDSLGWPVIQHWAERLGVSSALIESAESDFEGEEFTDLEPADQATESTALMLAKAELASAPSKSTKGLKVNDGVLEVGVGSRKEKKRKSGSVNLINVPSAEIQIADSIEEELRDYARFVPAEKRWIIWNGEKQGWSHPEGTLLMERWIQDELAAYVLREGSGWNESTRAKLLTQGKVSSVERLLRARMFVKSASLNSVPCTLQTPDGAFDLKTGERMVWAQQRELLDTRSTSVSPKNKPTPTFDRLINHLCCGDEGTKNWLLHYLGYLLLGRPLAHILLVMYGPGGNGKGAFDACIQAILGSYAVTIDKGVVLESGRTDHKTGLYEVKGKRYWGVSEIRPGEAWNEAQVQAMTGGDMIKARGMGQDMQSIKPEGSFIIYTNHLPKFHQINNAIARRFRFLYSRWVPDEPDPLLGDKLALEAEGILFTIMTYAGKVAANQFRMPETPKAMQDSANELFAEQDTFFSWFNESMVRNHREYALYKDMRRSLDGYKVPGAQEEAFPDGSSPNALTDADFRQALKRVGLLVSRQRIDGKVEDVVLGVKWRPGFQPNPR